MDEIALMKMISNIGFPITITIYLLYRFEKRLEKLEQTIYDFMHERRGPNG